MASQKKARKYGAGVGSTVKKVMHERKAGTLRSGRSKKKVTSRKQAIAIALSEARAAGKKVPSPRSTSTSKKRASKKRTSKKRTSKKRTSNTSKKRTTKRAA
jgi:hypothetical protein